MISLVTLLDVQSPVEQTNPELVRSAHSTRVRSSIAVAGILLAVLLTAVPTTLSARSTQCIPEETEAFEQTIKPVWQPIFGMCLGGRSVPAAGREGR